MDETNKIYFKFGLGREINSNAELSALWATMKIENDKQLKRVHIYGDSKIVIDWATGKNDIRAPHLQNLLMAIRALQTSFKEVHFKHIYREYNMEVDTLSKQALAIRSGIIEGEIVTGSAITHFFLHYKKGTKVTVSTVIMRQEDDRLHRDLDPWLF